MDTGREFSGRIAVVTGGSEGLGRDACKALCEAGCEVFTCGRRSRVGEEAVRSMGPRAHFLQADLGLPEGVQSFASWVAGSAGRVDYLVNNVAFDDRVAFSDITAEVCDRFWRVNLRSHILVTRALLDLLRAGEGKSIVNLGTTNYLLGLEPFVAYNAAKSGIVGFTRSLARELGREGIRVNMVSPGWIMTEKQLRLHVTEDDKAGLLRDQALKFLLEPRHVSPAVLFLLGSASAAITGQELVVDGGKFMR